MNTTLTALTGFIAWTLFLLVLMEIIRPKLVVTKAMPAKGFQPDNTNLTPLMQRLARAHANCLEGLPIFGGLMLVAVVAGQSAVTDPLAHTLLRSPRASVDHPPCVAISGGGHPAFRGLCRTDGHCRLLSFFAPDQVALPAMGSCPRSAKTLRDQTAPRRLF